MSLLGQISNTVSYNIHTLTYNPEAEQFAKEAAAKEEAAKKEKEKKEATAAATKKKTEAAAAAAKKKKEEEEAAEQRRTFSLKRLLQNILWYTFLAILIVGAFALAVYGASLSVNLNVYQSWPYRILYAIWGFFFFWLVVPYVSLYKGWWKGKWPKYYSLFPLIPYRFNYPLTERLFGWLTFRPDAQIENLKEWEH